jgi:hypothetical protein
MSSEERSAMAAEVAEGGCLCGAIRYGAVGEPANATLCHCRTCRKAAGAPLVAWVTFATNGFSFLSGVPIRFRSSPKVVRTFCGACGTPLTYVHEDFPSGIDVTICSLDDPARFQPADHTWVSHRLPWMHVDDHLPVYPQVRSPS